MKYLLFIWGDESVWDSFTPEDQMAEFHAYDAYTRWLEEKGWMLGGDALLGSPATTRVQLREGRVLTTDGPFAETKEQIGGYYLIECDNLDEAIEAAARIPAARGGTIEVRPVMDLPTA